MSFDRDGLIEQIREAIGEIIGESAQTAILPEAELGEVIDSLDIVDILFTVNRQFGVKLPSQLWEEIDSGLTPAGLPCYSIANLVDEVVHQWDGKPPGHNLKVATAA